LGPSFESLAGLEHRVEPPAGVAANPQRPIVASAYPPATSGRSGHEHSLGHVRGLPGLVPVFGDHMTHMGDMMRQLSDVFFLFVTTRQTADDGGSQRVQTVNTAQTVPVLSSIWGEHLVHADHMMKDIIAVFCPVAASTQHDTNHTASFSTRPARYESISTSPVAGHAR
jgi:hypothetical protein